MTALNDRQIEQITANATAAGNARNSAKHDVIEFATQGQSAKAISAKVHHLAEAEAIQEVWLRVQHAANAGISVEALQNDLMRILFQGADDSWSGRGNDLARTTFDAKRDEIRTVIERVLDIY